MVDTDAPWGSASCDWLRTARPAQPQQPEARWRATAGLVARST